MTWIQTASGRAVFPLTLQPGDFDLRDIAHHLSQLCRFTGATRVFYSVAEHSVRVSEALDDLLLSRKTQRWGLMHDAVEAYLGDVAAPLKRTDAWTLYRYAEESAQLALSRRYALGWPIPRAVLKMDERLCATEKRDLMAPPPAPWGLRAEPLDETIEPWSARTAERRFLAECRRLGIE